MDTYLNHITLTGTLERDPITRFADHGTQQVSFTLRLIEAGPAGQAFTLFVPCEAYGQAGPAGRRGLCGAGELAWLGPRRLRHGRVALDRPRRTG